MIYSDYVSKHNSNRPKQIIILIIPNGEGFHYLAVKKLSALFRGTTSKHRGYFYNINFYNINSFATEKKHEFHKKVCKSKNFYITF